MRNLTRLWVYVCSLNRQNWRHTWCWTCNSTVSNSYSNLNPKERQRLRSIAVIWALTFRLFKIKAEESATMWWEFFCLDLDVGLLQDAPIPSICWYMALSFITIPAFEIPPDALNSKGEVKGSRSNSEDWSHVVCHYQGLGWPTGRWDANMLTISQISCDMINWTNARHAKRWRGCIGASACTFSKAALLTCSREKAVNIDRYTGLDMHQLTLSLMVRFTRPVNCV